MKFTAATTLLCATLALATPAPLAGPLVPETIPEFRHALTARAAAAVPDLDTRASKPKGSSSGNTTSAATSMSPSSALLMGVLGLGVVEVVRLWN